MPLRVFNKFAFIQNTVKKIILTFWDIWIMRVNEKDPQFDSE